MDHPDIYIYIYTMFVGHFFCHSHYVATLSPEFFEIKGDEMWSLYAEKLRLLAERFEEAPRLPMGRLLDFRGGR